jgi:hypothetical protein
MQNMGPVHDTDSRELPDAGEVFALGTIAHADTVAAGEGAGLDNATAVVQTTPTATGASRRR